MSLRIFVTSLLATAPLTAQAAGPSEFAAALAREVNGDPVQAAKSLESALATMTTKHPAYQRTMAALAVLYGRLQQLDKRKALLAKLVDGPEPYAGWAKQAAAQDETDKSDGRSAFVRLIHELDNGTAIGNSPKYYELVRLGSLAVPALIGELDKLGYYGLSNAFMLFRAFPDPALYPVVEKMLRSEDRVRQTVAARFLQYLPADVREELAQVAIASKELDVRVGGIRALLPLANRRRDMQQRVLEMAKSESPRVRVAAIELLSDKAFGDRKLAATTLESFVGDADPDIVSRALYSWGTVCEATDEGSALALLERVRSPRLAESMYKVATEQFKTWTRVQLELLDTNPSWGGAIASLWRDQQPALDDATWIRLLKHENNGVAQLALDMLRMRRCTDAAPAVVELLDKRQRRSPAFTFLLEIAPELLAPHLPELYEDTQMRQAVAWAIPNVVEASQMPWIVELLFRESSAHPSHQNPYLLIIQRRSTIDHWDLLTELCDPSREKTRKLGESLYGYTVKSVIAAVERWFVPPLIASACERLPRMDSKLAHAVMKLVGHAASEKDIASIRGLLERSLEAMRNDKTSRKHAFGEYVPHKELATVAISLLGKLHAPNLVDTLAPLLDHDNDEVAAAAFEVLIEAAEVDRKQLFARMLAKTNNPGFLSSLLRHDLVARDPDLRKAAVTRLSEWSSESYIDSADDYLARLGKADRERFAESVLKRDRAGKAVPDWLLQSALRAFGSLKSAANVETLAGFLDHTNTGVRETAVIQLGRTFSRQAGPYLIEALKDDNEAIANLAKQALAKIRDYLTEKAKWEGEFGKDK